MKTKYALILILNVIAITFANPISAQITNESNDTTDYCHSRWVISTDPSSPVNTQQPSAANHFDWKTTTGFPYYDQSSTSSYSIDAPWIETDPLFNYLKLAKSTNSDYYPQDGWELFKQNLGLLNDQSTVRLDAPAVSYIMLYNRFTGVMRLFGALNQTTLGFNTVVVEISYLNPSSPSNPSTGLSSSGFLSLHGAEAQPLDQETSNTLIDVAIPTYFPDNVQKFFWVDFPIGYDPCECHYRSTIQVGFRFLEKGTIALKGTMIQHPITVVNNNSSNGNAQVIGDVIGGVTNIAAGFIDGGATTFTGIDDLIKALKDSKMISTSDYSDLSFLGTIIGAGQTFYDAENPSTTPSSSTTASSVAQTKAQAADFTKALATFNTMFTTSTSTGQSSASSLPATLSLQGTDTVTANVGGSGFNFSTPGSLYSALNKEENTTGARDNTPETNLRPEYPAYNKILGTFALLQTPTLQRFDSLITSNIGSPDGSYYDVGNKLVLKVKNDLVYAFNPIMHADLTKTKISVAIVVHSNCIMSCPSLLSSLNLCQTPINFAKMGTSNLDWITPFVPVGCATNLIGSLFYGYDNCDLALMDPKTSQISLRVLVDFVSTDINRHGEPNTSTLVFTYPVNIEEIEEDLQPNGDPLNSPPSGYSHLTNGQLDSTINTNQNYTFDFNSIVERTFNIDAILTANSDRSVNFFAGENFILSPGAQIGPGIHLMINPGFKCSTTLPPQTVDNVINYCNGTLSGLTYNANQVSTSSPYVITPKSSADYSQFDWIIFPNPAQNEASLNLSLPQNNQLSLEIVDITGKTSRTLFIDKSFAAGSSQISFDISNLSSGVYFCKIYNATMSQVKKLVIVDK